MKKWYDEEYEWEIEVTGFLRSDHTERYCRNGEEIGDKYTCTYGCPVNADGQGICSKTMMMLYPIMEAVRSGGNLENVGGSSQYVKDIVCPDGCVMFRLTATPLGNENFYKGEFWKEQQRVLLRVGGSDDRPCGQMMTRIVGKKILRSDNMGICEAREAD